MKDLNLQTLPLQKCDMPFNKELQDIFFLSGSVASGMMIGASLPSIGGPVLMIILGIVAGVVYLRFAK